ncbi:hypothetical protein PI125_g831 [Phytophthora idaei]|nr:hypothetical protein PI125_g831 [Phytophthora idaei]
MIPSKRSSWKAPFQSSTSGSFRSPPPSAEELRGFVRALYSQVHTLAKDMQVVQSARDEARRSRDDMRRDLDTAKNDLLKSARDLHNLE